jgi:hypothetical protein
MTDAWDAPPQPGACPWCSTTNPPDARQCRSCGAAIAQREDLGGVVVPGVTGVDPNLLGTQASLASPMLRSQGTMSAINAVSHVNATLGLAAAAAILGQDSVKGMLGMKDADLGSVGVPSEIALQAVEKLAREQEARERAEREAGAPSGDGPVAGAASAGVAAAPDPWRDLPTSVPDATPDPWADLPTPTPEADPPPAPTPARAPDPWADLPTPTPDLSPDPWADLPDKS